MKDAYFPIRKLRPCEPIDEVPSSMHSEIKRLLQTGFVFSHFLQCDARLMLLMKNFIVLLMEHQSLFCCSPEYWNTKKETW